MSDPALNFPITEARLVGLFLECIAYGIFLVTFPLCMRALLWNQGEIRRLRTVNWPMFTASILLAVFVTFDVIITLIWLIKAFVFTASGGAQYVFTDISNWINVIRTVNFFVPVLIGDLVLIYRGWVVYSHSYRAVLFPAFIWVCATAVGSYIIHAEGNLHVHGPLQVDSLTPFYTSFLVITVAQNFITTAMIVLRIRQVDRSSTGCITGVRRKTKLQRVMRIVIESGLLYTATAIISLGTYLSGSFAYNSVTDAELPILVIAFNLIIIRAKSQPSENTEYAFTSVRESAIQIKVPSMQLQSLAVRSGIHVEEETNSSISDPKLSQLHLKSCKDGSFLVEEEKNGGPGELAVPAV
ncbi:hypothetical protein ONZ45_g13262 [Pleurotus djamor]|nr:hypothetical protein ONZ45_g13262 [Pleurotus djamor]